MIGHAGVSLAEDHVKVIVNELDGISALALTQNDTGIRQSGLMVTDVQATEFTHGSVSLSGYHIEFIPEDGYSGTASSTISLI